MAPQTEGMAKKIVAITMNATFFISVPFCNF